MTLTSEKNIIKNKINTNLQSKIVSYEISEDDNFCDITVRLCYLDDYNLNGIRLLSSDGVDNCVQSLVNTPVVAYYNIDTDDFDGHRVSFTVNGVQFGTQAIGTHIKAWIQNDEVMPVFSNRKVVLPCIYGKARIWKSRFPIYYETLKKRMDDAISSNGSDKLGTSWEIQMISSTSDNTTNKNIPNPRSSDNWIFLGNCILGSVKNGITPAYDGTSEVLEISSCGIDLELSNALSKDNKKNKLKDKYVQSTKMSLLNLINNNIEKGSINKMPKAKKIVTASLTIYDLYQKISEQLNPRGWDSQPYYSIWSVYPEEKKVICQDIEASEDDLMVFTYTVDGNDNLTLSEGVEKKLSVLLSEMTHVNINMNLDDTAKMLSTKETKINELEKELSTVNKELSDKTEAIAKLGEQITNKDKEIAELKPFKEEHDTLVAEKEAKDKLKKQEELRTLATKGGYISEDELEKSEKIKKMIEEVDEKGIKAEIAERVIAKLDEKPSIETSDTSNKSNIKTDLTNTDEGLLTATDIIKSMLVKNN